MIKHNSSKQAYSSLLSKQYQTTNAWTLQMLDLLCSDSTPMALSMSMWMHVHSIETIKP